jgi:hypothetical protein
MKDIDMRIRGSAIALTNPTESKLLDGRSGVPTLGTRWLMGTRSDSSGRFTRAAGYPVRGLFVHPFIPQLCRARGRLHASCCKRSPAGLVASLSSRLRLPGEIHHRYRC